LVIDPAVPAGPTVEPLLWDRDQTAVALGVSAKTVARMAAAGALPGSVKLGRRRLFSRKAIELWIAQGCPRPVRRR
jgi:excisionase family DNA binding protein